MGALLNRLPPGWSLRIAASSNHCHAKQVRKETGEEMSIRKSIIAGVALLGATLGAFAAAAPAVAASGDGLPNYGEFVLWRDSNFASSIYDTAYGVSSYSGLYYVNSTAGLNDTASSISNYHQTYSVRTYVDWNYGGAYISCLPYGQASGNISYAYYSLGSFNDKLSSHQFV